MEIKKLKDSGKDKSNIARKNILRKSKEIKGIPIRGYDFDNGINYEEIIKSYSSTGAQASNLGKAIEIINEMIKENAFIFFGYTSSMVSSGLREIFRWLVKHKKINVIVTTAGGVEEDIIKCLGDFYLGDFRASGAELRKKGINRIGNIYAANNRYIEFEEFFQPLLKELYDEQKQTGKIISASEIVWKLGEKINDEKSICYWAWKNKIKIYCPAITDGALGDNIYFFKSKNPEFKIDITEDIVELNNSTIGLKKSGVILLGIGVIKHSILNANMFRNGADYAVYVNEAEEHNASDAGALPEEAISWGKILPKAKHVKVFGDATIIFPLIVASTFARQN
ncbi:MAG: deoxyhypusine synthase, deoxyhypusine synthase [archaeon GW2011_AR19]|nr:MAG: deoxyhypusine synthase, deoxyhypusine synthase [archaeon GW2011_AR19]